MGNLLLYNPAFDWADNAMDRTRHIGNLHDAVLSARDFEDKLYYLPELFFGGLDNQNFFLLVCKGYENFRRSFPWIKEPEYQMLFRIFYYFRQSPNNSKDLHELYENTEIQNNAWIGIKIDCLDFLVYDNPTWNKFHSSFVSRFTFEQRKQDFEYFSRFYVPELTSSLNQINKMIDAGGVHKSIKRIDQDKLEHEKIHVHFNCEENCALNIDGTWKHKVEGFQIPREACNYLNEWGFKLPPEYYTSRHRKM
jgi:hypothetical protein